MATIKDVARLAGVGLGTASRVVNKKGSVSAAAAARVNAAVKSLDFRPSHAARSLLSGTSQMIGVYVPILRGTFYTPILQLVDAQLRAGGRHMVVAFGCGTGDERRQAIEGIEFLIERDCDGLIVFSNDLIDEDVVAIHRKQPKLVILNRLFDTIAEQCFSADHRQGGMLAAHTFLDLQHREFAIISGPTFAPDNVARIGGFLDELKKNGIDIAGIPIIESDFSPEGGWKAAATLLDSGRRFTALFCANDEMAVGALSYFQQAGIAVPHQVSVMGYDDTYTAEYTAPRLTSIHMPMQETTSNAVNWLLNKCYDMAHPVERQFPVKVTWRASVTALRQGR
ncbi:MAG: substrate-binding domain-containing protein [Pseudomonadota bacterium]